MAVLYYSAMAVLRGPVLNAATLFFASPVQCQIVGSFNQSYSNYIRWLHPKSKTKTVQSGGSPNNSVNSWRCEQLLPKFDNDHHLNSRARLPTELRSPPNLYFKMITLFFSFVKTSSKIVCCLLSAGSFSSTGMVALSLLSFSTFSRLSWRTWFFDGSRLSTNADILYAC